MLEEFHDFVQPLGRLNPETLSGTALTTMEAEDRPRPDAHVEDPTACPRTATMSQATPMRRAAPATWRWRSGSRAWSREAGAAPGGAAARRGSLDPSGRCVLAGARAGPWPPRGRRRRASRLASGRAA